jgi:hypothetical protein
MAMKYAKPRAMAPTLESPSTLPQTRLRVGSFLLEQSQIACNRGRYEMAVELPSQERLMGSGGSAQEAFVDFCTRVSNLLFVEATEQSSGSSKSTRDFEALRELVARRDADAARRDASKATRTKERQKTVGVTSKMSLVERIGQDPQSESFASVARELFEKGLDTLDGRLDAESSNAVFDDFQSVYSALPDPATRQWMLRVERRTYERALVLANEYGKSLSNLAALCIAYGLRR